ncbi:MAG: hypothetical protein AAGH40_03695 [Verrucomicrobiota bacterium]
MKRSLQTGALIAAVLTANSLSAAISVTGNFFPNANRDPNFWVNGGDSGTNGAVGGGSFGTLQVDEGSILDLRDGIFGNNGNTGIATVTDAGSTLNISRNLLVGRRSAGTSGTLNILNGATLTTGSEATLGVETGSSGTIRVDGIGSRWDVTSGILAGEAGSGSLTVSNGAQVTSAVMTLGRQTGSSATLRIEGNGGSNETSLTVGNDFIATNRSNVVVTNGGEISSSFFFINGSFLLESSGSSLSSDSQFNIGSDGIGTPPANMIVQDGARVNTEELFIGGNFVSSSGELTLRGAGTSWNNGVRALIGGSDASVNGTGVVNILDGASFRTFRAIIGDDTSVAGRVLIRDEGSRFTSTENSLIDQNGTLTIHSGGFFRTERDLNVNPGGVIHLFLDGSTMIQTGRTNSSLFGDFVNNGTTNLFASAGLAAGDHRPIVVGRDRFIGGVGTYNAIGGSYNPSTGLFTVSAITTDTNGALGGQRVQYDRGLVVSFADSVGDIEFEVTRIFPVGIDDGFLVAAYSFDTELTTPTGLSFFLAEDATLDDLTFWYRATISGPWEIYDPTLTSVDGSYATLLTDQFSDYAVTSTFFIPEPGSYGFFIGLLALSWISLRRRTDH